MASSVEKNVGELKLKSRLNSSPPRKSLVCRVCNRSFTTQPPPMSSVLMSPTKASRLNSNGKNGGDNINNNNDDNDNTDGYDSDLDTSFGCPVANGKQGNVGDEQELDAADSNALPICGACKVFLKFEHFKFILN